MIVRWKRHRRSRRAAVLAEFAIVLPVFVLAMIGILVFGRAVMIQQIVTNAAREGARRAVPPGATNSQVTTLVDNYLLSTSLGAPGRQIEILDQSGTALNLDDADSGDIIQVRVVVPHDEVGFGFGPWFAGKDMVSLVRMRKE